MFSFHGGTQTRSGVKGYDVKGESDMMPTPNPLPPPGIPICYLAYSRKNKTTAQPSVEERNEFKTNLT